MNKEDYTLRIVQATPVQLVIISHELLIDFLNVAITAFDEGDTDLFFKNINKSKDALTQLIDGLDYSNEVAQSLYSLYQYAGERLNKALFGKDVEAAKEILEMFCTLLQGWQAIEDTPDDRLSEAPENESPQVYAGLTYHKDGLAEYIPQDEGRGFKA